MASMANLALKNAAGGAVVGTVLTPSAGDTVPAQWRVETVAPPFARPTLNMVSRSNAKRDVRRVSGKIMMPYAVLNSTTTLYEGVSQPAFSFEMVVGTNVPSTLSDELVAFITSYFADPLIVASLKSQISPT